MRLIDCFTELIVYVAQTVHGIHEAQPPVETVKTHIDQLFEKSRRLKDRGRFSDQDYRYALLSVIVWIDEAILNSTWEHRRDWSREPLQRRHFNIADGGMEFFERLDQLGHEDRDVREVAYYCLTLGLTGKYIEKGDRVVLDHLKASNLRRLYGSSAGEPTLENRRLFPEAYQKQTEAPPPRKRTFSWRAVPVFIGLLPIGLFVGLMLVYTYLLKLDLSQFIQR
jgi:type VI secretion system protein ImpK